MRRSSVLIPLIQSVFCDTLHKEPHHNNNNMLSATIKPSGFMQNVIILIVMEP